MNMPFVNDDIPAAGQAVNDDLPNVSIRSTKPELFNAYQNLVRKYEENIKNKKTDQVKKTAEKQIVEKTGGYTVENIVQNLQVLKTDMVRGADELAEKLVGEAKKIQEVQAAIKIEEENLRELYDIKVTAETMEEFIRAQKQQKEDFDSVYAQAKLAREREEEEYQYNLKQERKKEQAIWAEKQEAWKKREEELKAREQELADLRQRTEEFPAKLEVAVKEAEEKTESRVKKETQTAADLLAKEVEGEKKVMAVKLQYLEELATKQNEQIESLKQKSDEAARQVQTIAEKALESSSGKQTLRAVSDIAMQQAGKATES